MRIKFKDDDFKSKNKKSLFKIKCFNYYKIKYYKNSLKYLNYIINNKTYN